MKAIKFLLLILLAHPAIAQPFADEIVAFKKQDRISRSAAISAQHDCWTTNSKIREWVKDNSLRLL